MKKKINNLGNLTKFRKKLRNNMTPAEAKLWSLLRRRKLAGRRFRRQFSVGKYILDFYCFEEQLAVELDGQGHYETVQGIYDDDRKNFLNEMGICVLRFENRIVWDNPDWLLGEIKKRFR